jgi:hypothetical protein
VIDFARTWSLALVAVALAACAGDKPKDHGAWEAKEGSNFVGNGEKDDAAWESHYQPTAFNWVGVRHDLGINPARPRKENCSCLSVEVGSPGDSKFVWRGQRPDVTSANLAVAISSAGLSCPGGATNPGDRRPSISGVYRNNGDVIIEIEEAVSDRPIATGAIIAPPDVRGRIYVRPRLKTLPYAKPASGNLCRVQ